MAIVIDAVKGAACGARPHIIKKALKRVAPFRANRDSSAAIVFEARVPWVRASLGHIEPRDVFAALCFSVLAKTLGHSLCMETPAADDFARAQARKLHCGFGPTVAFAEPQCLNALVTVAAYGREAAVCLTGDVE